MTDANRLGLALSGGGFRATFFHFGVVRWLRDAGLLDQVRHISSVSGGSILAGDLVLHWDEYRSEEGLNTARERLSKLARIDVRGRIMRRLVSHWPITYMEELKSLRVRRRGTVRNLLLQRFLAKYLFKDATLADAAQRNPGAPRLDILATNLSRGSQSYFAAGQFCPSDDSESVAFDTPLARSVAISASFPGFFPTTEVTAEDLMTDPEAFPQVIYLTDGGVFDNLGLRRFKELDSEAGAETKLTHLAICDASGHFDWLVEHESLGPLKTALRSSEILMKRLAEVELEASTIEKKRTTHLSISRVVTREEIPDALPELIQRQLRHIRTDLDAFTTTEIDYLERHGYEVAAASEFRTLGVGGSAWALPAASTDVEDTEAIARELRDGRFRRIQPLSPRDPISYLYLAIFLGVVILLLWRVERSITAHHLDSAFRNLEVGTLGELEDKDEQAALLELLQTGSQRFPERADTQLHVALNSYRLLHSDPDAETLEEAQEIFEDSIEILKQLSSRMTPDQEVRYLVIRGHYHLQHEEYRDALSYYRQYRKKKYPRLYVLSYNLCNTAIEVEELGFALAECEKAQHLVQEQGREFWPADFLTAKLHHLEGRFDQAVEAFLDAYEAADRDEDGKAFVGYFKKEVGDVEVFCGEDVFRSRIPDLCA